VGPGKNPKVCPVFNQIDCQRKKIEEDFMPSVGMAMQVSALREDYLQMLTKFTRCASCTTGVDFIKVGRRV
jgi:hypothetical protein